ncbi:tyrosine-type recombinase/integrase [Spirosoma sp.]|uniref:tyrosine-type recombinase/integrase n=1 Tax=Spirosoma sp. TaxID=1899569 RepID=UPI003B3A6D06
MGKPTLAVRLKYEPNRDGERVIRIRITKDRQSAFWALPFQVTEKDFNENGTKLKENWIRKSYRDCKLYNARIYDAYQKAEAAIAFFEKRDLDYSAADVRQYVERGGFPDKLLPYFADHIQKRRNEAGDDLGKLETVGVYESTIKVLRLYLRSVYALADTFPDEQIDERYWTLGKLNKRDILDLKAWLETRYSRNSVATYLGKLRHVLYEAADAGLVSYEKFPMRGITAASVRKKVDRLQDEEIQKLASVPAEKKHTGGRKAVTSTEHARPLAMSLYLAHGARLGDAIIWRIENYVIEGEQHRLRYTTSKNKKSMSVLLDEEAVALIAPYLVDKAGKPRPKKAFLFPYLPDDFDKLSTEDQFIHLRNAKQRARQQIIRLGRQVGLEKRVTPHVMRHSFADMLRRSGVRLETRQEALGHSDIKTTRDYEEQFDQEAIDEISKLYANRRTTVGQQS